MSVTVTDLRFHGLTCAETHTGDEIALSDVGSVCWAAGPWKPVADVFKLLSDPTRVRIVDALTHGERCVCDLAALVGLSESAVSHQLRLLSAARLVRVRRLAARRSTPSTIITWSASCTTHANTSRKPAVSDTCCTSCDTHVSATPAPQSLFKQSRRRCTASAAPDSRSSWGLSLMDGAVDRGACRLPHRHRIVPARPRPSRLDVHHAARARHQRPDGHCRIGAGALGEWFEGATVVWLFGVAQVLESLSMDRARDAIRKLMVVAPAVALVRRMATTTRSPRRKCRRRRPRPEAG